MGSPDAYVWAAKNKNEATPSGYVGEGGFFIIKKRGCAVLRVSKSWASFVSPTYRATSAPYAGYVCFGYIADEVSLKNTNTSTAKAIAPTHR